MVYTCEEHDYGLHIREARLWLTPLRNTTIVYTFEEHDNGLHI